MHCLSALHGPAETIGGGATKKPAGIRGGFERVIG